MITTDTVNARVYIPFCEADNRLALCIMWAPFMTLLYGPSPEIIAVTGPRSPGSRITSDVGAAYLITKRFIFAITSLL